MMLYRCHLWNSAVPQEGPSAHLIGLFYLVRSRWLDKWYVDNKAGVCLFAQTENMGVSNETLVYEVGKLEKLIPYIHRRFFLGGVVRQLAEPRRYTRPQKGGGAAS